MSKNESSKESTTNLTVYLYETFYSIKGSGKLNK